MYVYIKIGLYIVLLSIGILIYPNTINSAMGKLKGMVTAASLARTSSDSLKTTIPTMIAAQLDISPKDRLEWRIDKVEGVWVATIRKA